MKLIGSLSIAYVADESKENISQLNTFGTRKLLSVAITQRKQQWDKTRFLGHTKAVAIVNIDFAISKNVFSITLVLVSNNNNNIKLL